MVCDLAGAQLFDTLCMCIIKKGELSRMFILSHMFCVINLRNRISFHIFSCPLEETGNHKVFLCEGPTYMYVRTLNR